MDYCSKVVKLTGNLAKSKNKALKEMLKTDKNYFFLVEDNCKVLSDEVYDKFIQVSKATGIEALMWPGGAENKKLPFEEDKHIEYWTDFTSSFCMFTRNAVEKVGFLDEVMPANTWQELEYAKRIGEIGLSTPFGMFAAPRNIDGYFKVAKPKDEYKNLRQMDEALKYWQKKTWEDFPVSLVEGVEKLQENAPITEML